MTWFFNTLGWLIAIIGFGWCVLIAAQPSYSDGASAIVILAKVIAMMPGLGVAGSGLIFLAVGGVLWRLDRIVDNTQPARASDFTDRSKWSDADRNAYDLRHVGRREPAVR